MKELFKDYFISNRVLSSSIAHYLDPWKQQQQQQQHFNKFVYLLFVCLIQINNFVAFQLLF